MDEIDETIVENDETLAVVEPIIKDIIDNGCDQAEITVDEKQIIEHLNGLNSDQLLRIYNQLVAEKNEILHWNYLLNKNTYKYFVRKKSSQALIKDNPEDVARLEANFKEKLSQFGEIISKHENVRVDLLARFDNLARERNELFKVRQKSIAAFEDIVRETGKSLKSLQSGQRLTPEALENTIGQVQATRKNMSEVRLKFIKTLDRHTQMEEKSIEIQDLGDGLRMNDFSQLREERQCLEEKIEERNNTIEKLRLRCFADTQALSHVREKKHMLEGTEEDELQELRDTIMDLEMTRTYMNDCNANCERLRRLYAETSTNCGLLDKPELLRNYDDTKFEFKTTEESVLRIRSEIDDINKKIVDLKEILQLKNDSRGTLRTKSANETQTIATTTKSNCNSQLTMEIKSYTTPH